MPHAIVKLVAGRTEEQKQRIAAAVSQAIVASAGAEDGAVSVGIEDVAKDAWMEAVYEPDISGKPETIYKKPGYGPS